jgi:hypothetical protein
MTISVVFLYENQNCHGAVFLCGSPRPLSGPLWAKRRFRRTNFRFL